MNVFDKIIIGGGFYGLYAALYCGKNGKADYYQLGGDFVCVIDI